MKKNKAISAQDLVETLIELNGMISEQEKQNPKLFENNPPYHMRYKQIMAIQAALGMDETLRSLTKGDFINKRKIEFYSSLKEELEIQKIIRRYGSKKIELNAKNLFDSAEFTYQKLIDYRIKLNECVELYAKSMVGNPLYLMPFEIIGKVNSKIEKEIEIIDRKLAYFIDPQKQSFGIDFLVETFGYPNVDIEMVDLDNF